MSNVTELHLITDFLLESQSDIESVDILVEVENISLDSHRIPVSYRRTDADIAHSVILVPKRFDIHEIDPAPRHKLQWLIQLHIRRRKTDSASQPISGNDHAIELIALAQHIVGCDYIPFCQRVTNFRRADDDAGLRRETLLSDDLQPESAGYLRCLFGSAQV